MKKAPFVFLALIMGILALFHFDVIWRSPPFYSPEYEATLSTPIICMDAYGDLSGHVRPYMYEVQAGEGQIFIAGLDHTRDSENPQIDALRESWHNFRPTVALVEGRMGFYFRWIHDPIELYGESGETARLAKKERLPLYTWEPTREEEVSWLLKKYPARQLALFYSLRPYFSNFRFGKPDDPDKIMQHYIGSRTDYEGLRGQLRDVAQIDSIWQADFPNRPDWRDTSDEWGWPEGYLTELANESNIARDVHLINILFDLANKGERVFATVGSSHAFRIEEAVRAEAKID